MSFPPENEPLVKTLFDQVVDAGNLPRLKKQLNHHLTTNFGRDPALSRTYSTILSAIDLDNLTELQNDELKIFVEAIASLTPP